MDSFSKSHCRYGSFETYPRNLAQDGLFVEGVQKYERELRDREGDLLESEDSSTYVIFRDINSRGDHINAGLLCSDADIQKWLADGSLEGPDKLSEIDEKRVRTKPMFRFIYLTADDSFSSLLVTRRSLTRILSYHQVMPEYLGLMPLFGKSEAKQDCTFGAFRQRIRLKSHHSNRRVHGPGRSGRDFEICYALKTVSCKTWPQNKPEDQDWAIRPAAIHHQFDIEGLNTWIVTRGGPEIYDKVKALTHEDYGRPADRNFSTPGDSFRVSLTMHLLFCNWAFEMWRVYVNWLEVRMQQETHWAVVGRRKENRIQKGWTPANVSAVQHVKELADHAGLTLTSNMQTLSALREFYASLPGKCDFPLAQASAADIQEFCQEIRNLEDEFGVSQTKANYIFRAGGDRQQLILQHIQHQTTERMEHLNTDTRKIAITSQHEAVIMRILAVIAAIFLPATFVSAFFSTDVVKYQNMDAEVSFSAAAMYSWLEVTLPLTLITLGVAYIYYVKSERKKKEMKETLPIYNIT